MEGGTGAAVFVCDDAWFEWQMVQWYVTADAVVAVGIEIDMAIQAEAAICSHAWRARRNMQVALLLGLHHNQKMLMGK